MNSELREKIARAMWEAREATMPPRTRMKFEDRTQPSSDTLGVMLNAALSAITEAGFVVVPREPTENMMTRGKRQPNIDDMWRAMIEAAGQ